MQVPSAPDTAIAKPVEVARVDMSPAAVGDFVFAGPFATSVLAFFLVMTHLFPTDDHSPVRTVVAAIAAVALILSSAAQLRLRRWSRRQTRAGGR